MVLGPHYEMVLQMVIGTIVLLIGREDDMPPIGVVGEIVGWYDGDWEVLFPHYPCQVGESTWCCLPEWLTPIGHKHCKKKENEGGTRNRTQVVS